MRAAEKKRLLEKMTLCYGELYAPEDLLSMVSDIELLLEMDSKYRKPIKEWLNDKSEVSEVLLTCLDGEKSWSLREIAKKLHPQTPNIPVAALLLALYEEFPVTLSQIIPIAEETCWCDGRILRAADPVCTAAELDKETEQWFFLLPDTTPENLVFCQLWQVLTQVATLTPVIFMENEPGTLVKLRENGCYCIFLPEETES